MKRSRLIVVGIVSMLILAGVGCGGSDPPTSVTVEDLGQDGNFWVDLTPDLKEELVVMGKGELADERPDGSAVYLDAMDNDELISEINDEYANEGNLDTEIYDAYVAANQELAGEQLDALAPQLAP